MKGEPRIVLNSNSLEFEKKGLPHLHVQVCLWFSFNNRQYVTGMIFHCSVDNCYFISGDKVLQTLKLCREISDPSQARRLQGKAPARGTSTDSFPVFPRRAVPRSSMPPRRRLRPAKEAAHPLLKNSSTRTVQHMVGENECRLLSLFLTICQTYGSQPQQLQNNLLQFYHQADTHTFTSIIVLKLDSRMAMVLVVIYVNLCCIQICSTCWIRCRVTAWTTNVSWCRRVNHPCQRRGLTLVSAPAAVHRQHHPLLLFRIRLTMPTLVPIWDRKLAPCQEAAKERRVTAEGRPIRHRRCHAHIPRPGSSRRRWSAGLGPNQQTLTQTSRFAGATPSRSCPPSAVWAWSVAARKRPRTQILAKKPNTSHSLLDRHRHRSRVAKTPLRTSWAILTLVSMPQAPRCGLSKTHIRKAVYMNFQCTKHTAIHNAHKCQSEKKKEKTQAWEKKKRWQYGPLLTSNTMLTSTFQAHSTHCYHHGNQYFVSIQIQTFCTYAPHAQLYILWDICKPLPTPMWPSRYTWLRGMCWILGSWVSFWRIDTVQSLAHICAVRVSEPGITTRRDCEWLVQMATVPIFSLTKKKKRILFYWMTVVSVRLVECHARPWAFTKRGQISWISTSSAMHLSKCPEWSSSAAGLTPLRSGSTLVMFFKNIFHIMHTYTNDVHKKKIAK